MKYTLDSLHQVQSALRKKFPSANVTDVPVIVAGTEMKGYTNEDERKAYFGAVTAGDDTFIELYWRGNKVITIDSGSQIIMAFTQMKFVDAAGGQVDPSGQFRGAEIQILS